MNSSRIYGAWAVAVTLAFAWVLLSWLTNAAVLAAERSGRLEAENRVATLTTRVAQLQPTPIPCNYVGSYYCLSR